MADSKKAILLRISPELWESLNGWARDELRSVNAQIEYVLRSSASAESALAPPAEEPPTHGAADAETAAE